MGVNLNRYRLAQQSPKNEAETLALKTNLIVNNKKTKTNIKKFYSLMTQGLYFLGFDTQHVGFAYKNNTQVFLIHSNYLNSQGVMTEKIEDSKVFAHYQKITLVPLSSNPHFIKAWLNKERIVVKIY